VKTCRVALKNRPLNFKLGFGAGRKRNHESFTLLNLCGRMVVIGNPIRSLGQGPQHGNAKL